MKKKSIGILGGMGPRATADLLAKITKFTGASCAVCVNEWEKA